MKILAIDTATEACSAALLIEGQLIEIYEVCPRLHTKKILKMVDDVLTQASTRLSQLDGIAYGQGPGSFAGVRLAISVAQGLGYGANVPVIPISSMAAMAKRAFMDYPSTDFVVTALDARMNEMYLGLYEQNNGQVKPMLNDALVASSFNHQLIKENENLKGIGCGHGFSTYPELANQLNLNLIEILPEILPNAAQIALLAQYATAIKAQESHAAYLRNNVVQV